MRQLGPIHIVQGFPPYDLKAGNSQGAGSTTESRTISLKNYDHVMCLFNWGDTRADADAVINFWACSNIAGANAAAIDSFQFRKAQVAMATVSDLAGDTWSTYELMTDNTSDLHLSDMAISDAWNPNDSDADSINQGMTLVEFDAADIYNAADDGVDRDCFYVTISDTTASALCALQFLLLKDNRYQKEVPPTAITN
ncbi:MAG: hypothetical protein GY841_04425 [FCB group bacterium]|nr:hypothetical protein [FCB group bacterium]